MHRWAELIDAVARTVEDARARGRVPILLIDGPSGAGKSTLADVLVESWPTPERPALVRMDDLYPGWGGLLEGSDAVARTLLEPLRASGEGRWRSWDWEEDRPGPWHTVTGRAALIVEGCGALSLRAARVADLGIWLEADDTLRKQRALDRDGDLFAEHWDQWQAQFDDYLSREDPRGNASLIMDVTAWVFGDLPDRDPRTNVEA